MCRTVRFQGTPLYWVATGEIGKAMTLSHSGFTWQICHNPVITKVQRIYGLNRLSPRKLLPLCHTFSQCVPALMQLLHTEQLCRHCAWNTFLTDSRVHLIRVSQQRTARKNRWVHTHVLTKPQRMKAIVSSGNTLPRYNLTKRDRTFAHTRLERLIRTPKHHFNYYESHWMATHFSARDFQKCMLADRHRLAMHCFVVKMTQ